MSDELERKAPVSDDEATQDDDFEAHRKSVGASDDDGDDVEAHRKSVGASDEDSDDVEAHRKHGGS